MRRTIAATAAVLLLPALALEAQTDRRSLRGDRVAIHNIAGQLRVEGGSGSDVVVEIRRGGRDAGRLRVESGSIRGAETLRIMYPVDELVYPAMRGRGRTTLTVNEDGTIGGGGSSRWSRNSIDIRSSGSGAEMWADVTVQIPRGRTVAMHWGVGEVALRNVDGHITVDVASATIDGAGLRGSLHLDTGSGAITVADVQGDLNVDTGSGSVTLSNVRGSSLNIDSGSGSIRGSDISAPTVNVDVGSGRMQLLRVQADRVSLDTGSGSVEVEMLSNVRELTVDSGSGSVTLRLPSTTSAEVEVETGSGGITTDFPITMNRYERNHLRGRIGDGRGRITIETGSGGVRLLRN